MDNNFFIKNPQTVLWNRKPYILDMDKINSIEDIKNILKALNITVFEGTENIEHIKYLLKEKVSE